MGNIRSVPIVDKYNVHDTPLLDGTFAISSMEGWRKTMEDSHILINMNDYVIIGIFDGHGNDICSNFCKSNFQEIFQLELEKINKEMPLTPVKFKTILTNTFISLDAKFKDIAFSTKTSESNRAYDSGTTALVAIITETHYIIANAGDSRGLVIDKSEHKIKFATTDHKPGCKTEKLRIEKAGHCVSGNRIDDSISVARAIGDFQYKDGIKAPEEYAITCVPDVTIVQKDLNTLLVLACDGIWDVISNQCAMEYILRKKHHTFTNIIEFDRGHVCTIEKYYKTLSESSLCSELDSYPIENICEYLIDVALDLGSKDNFTVAIFNC